MSYVIIVIHLVAVPSILIATALFTLFALSAVTIDIYASTLSKEEPPIIEEGTSLNQTADSQDIDITIDPTESLPANSTQEISTEGATDIDLNSIPPSGVTVVIENETVYVTSRPVVIS